MRLACVMAGLFLAACGGNEARVALPLTAPDGVHRLVKDFIEICSRALSDQDGAEKLAVERGWGAAGDLALMKTTGVAAFEDPQDGSLLQITSLNYPHQEGTACLLVAREMSPDDLAPARIGEIKGILGDYSVIRAPDEVGRGLWSFIGPGGNVVSINVTASGNRFTQMNMYTSRRVTPKS